MDAKVPCVRSNFPTFSTEIIDQTEVMAYIANKEMTHGYTQCGTDRVPR